MQISQEPSKAKEIASEFLRIDAAAEFLNISRQLLSKLQRMGAGPRQRKVGRCVLYRRQDLIEWMEAR
jgi:predicted DNA-binding transcriptional regulator AlpA